MLKAINFKEQLRENYIFFEEKKRRPDLLGKTVKVTANQFPEIYQIAKNIEGKTQLNIPDLFVYEDFYYGMESKGIEKPWIEISASLLRDFSENEIEFMLAREMYQIQYKHTYYRILLEQSLQLLGKGYLPFSEGIAEDAAKVIYYLWSRISNYSADCFGYIVCMDIEASIKAILKCVLNSVILAENMNLLEYIKQGEAINGLHDEVYEATKSDEQFPYGPFRIKNLLAYSTSEKALLAKEEIKKEDKQ